MRKLPFVNYKLRTGEMPYETYYDRTHHNDLVKILTKLKIIRSGLWDLG